MANNNFAGGSGRSHSGSRTPVPEQVASGQNQPDDFRDDIDRPMTTSPSPTPAPEPELPPEPPLVITEPDLLIAQAYVDAIRSATLDEGGLDAETVGRLRNPIQGPVDLDADLRLSLDLFLSTISASRDTYTNTRASVLRRHPEDDILTHAQMKRCLAEMTGVTSLVNSMCVNSCVAFTGDFSDEETCPMCHEAHRSPDGAVRQEFHTIPIGPQLQALWRTEEGARNMRHRRDRTAQIRAEMTANNGRIPVYNDVYCGSDYLNAVRRGDIADDDMVLLFSIDGAQLYESKQSDCWIYIWVVLDLSPDLRYTKKHVLVGGFIPGPNKPKNIDSFIFPGLHHLAALQKEGLMVWDAVSDTIFRSFPYLLLDTADGPAMQYLNGLVGHAGAYGCRLYCQVKGRHKPGATNYYPAHLKPDNYSVRGCDHADIALRHIATPSAEEHQQNLKYLLQSSGTAQYKARRLATGISKPSIFSGLPSNRTFPIPKSFPADLMHLISLNIPELLLALWRGSLECDPGDDKSTWHWATLTGETWKAHGQRVADTKPYLPGSFDRPPRNPVEKISSGYKAWEWLMYVFGLGPAVFHNVLPHIYWRNFCKLVAGIRLLQQRSITSNQVQQAHVLLLAFVDEFEALYYQRKAERIHFCRQSLHALCHIARETIRLGPEAYFTQWTMERTIGNLGEEIKQPSNPYSNLSQRGILRSQVNAIKAIVPDLDPDTVPPVRGSVDIGDGYCLLRPRQRRATTIGGAEGDAIREYLEAEGMAHFDDDEYPQIIRWGRLMLPTKQIARTYWKESNKPLDETRMSRNVKVCPTQTIMIRQVLYILTSYPGQYQWRDLSRRNPILLLH
ncbi:hypothetical protein HWV62_41611 [Athelia sp. TMB]|nr:hypothetical protein HWV62_41611 [Athelia sp. TMB]